MVRVAVPVLVLKICTASAFVVLPVRSRRIVPVPGEAPSLAVGSVTLMVRDGRSAQVKFFPVVLGPTVTGFVNPDGVNTFG